MTLKKFKTEVGKIVKKINHTVEQKSQDMKDSVNHSADVVQDAMKENRDNAETIKKRVRHEISDKTHEMNKTTAKITKEIQRTVQGK